MSCFPDAAGRETQADWRRFSVSADGLVEGARRVSMERFVEAQAGVYETAAAELRAGRKRSHWMWFIFPQLAGLGYSPMAQRYALAGTAEAAAYLGHAVLGARLRVCAGILGGLQGKSALDIFGSPDDMKLRSCLTLFLAAAPGEAVLAAALDRYFAGRPDQRTLALLAYPV